MRLAILIPAYNEEKTLADVIRTLPKKLPKITYKEVVVIDDGSSDRTIKIIKKHKLTIISHHLNRGLGAALGTGFEYVKNNNFDCLITFDADGQHNPADIIPVLKPIINKKADIVIGSRLKKPAGHARHASKTLRAGMPWYRVLGIWGLNIITLIFFWVWTSDSQSGLRAFSKKAITKIQIKSNRMEVSSEFFDEAQRHNLKIIEVPIRSIYTKYSLNKGTGKGQFKHGFKIISKMIYRRFFAK